MANDALTNLQNQQMMLDELERRKTLQGEVLGNNGDITRAGARRAMRDQFMANGTSQLRAAADARRAQKYFKDVAGSYRQNERDFNMAQARMNHAARAYELANEGTQNSDGVYRDNRGYHVATAMPGLTNLGANRYGIWNGSKYDLVDKNNLNAGQMELAGQDSYAGSYNLGGGYYATFDPLKGGFSNFTQNAVDGARYFQGSALYNQLFNENQRNLLNWGYGTIDWSKGSPAFVGNIYQNTQLGQNGAADTTHYFQLGADGKINYLNNFTPVEGVNYADITSLSNLNLNPSTLTYSFKKKGGKVDYLKFFAGGKLNRR